MKVLVHEIKYSTQSDNDVESFSFEIDNAIVLSDEKLSAEVYKLVKEKTGKSLTECTIDV